VFGQRLEETVLYERRYGVRLVPLVVEQCVTFIRERGLHEVGLFRQPGQASLVKELQQAFDSGERPSFDSSTDVHTVASLLKLYLRQLPEPLVPHSCYQDFLLCGQKLRSDRTQGLGEFRNLLHELPVANFNLLNFICFLNEVQSYSGSNKMSDQNLATVFGPNILRAKAEDPQSIMGWRMSLEELLKPTILEAVLELVKRKQSYRKLGKQGTPPLRGPPVSFYHWTRAVMLREPLVLTCHQRNLKGYLRVRQRRKTALNTAMKTTTTTMTMKTAMMMMMMASTTLTPQPPVLYSVTAFSAQAVQRCSSPLVLQTSRGLNLSHSPGRLTHSWLSCRSRWPSRRLSTRPGYSWSAAMTSSSGRLPFSGSLWSSRSAAKASPRSRSGTWSEPRPTRTAETPRCRETWSCSSRC
uniref:Si:ch211-247j9.1 n=1 Tax=Seriola dumerili TaxID=41447 RepID=A0A3B4U165_SERDU